MQHTNININIDALIPAEEVTKKLNVTSMTLYRWVRDGKMPKPIKLGRNRFFRPEDIQRYIVNANPHLRFASDVSRNAEDILKQKAR